MSINLKTKLFSSIANCTFTLGQILLYKTHATLVYVQRYHQQRTIDIPWIPWNLSFRYILFHEKRLWTMLWERNARVNSHQRWKQTRFRVCFHLWCELTSTMNVMEWEVSWNSCIVNNGFVGMCCTIPLSLLFQQL